MRFLILLLFILTANHASASDYSFVSLYSANGFFTEKLLSFRIKSVTGSSFVIQKMTLPKPCYGMVDIHRLDIIHVYCAEETSTQFTLNILSNGKVTSVRSRLFEVKRVALMSSNPKPSDDYTGKSKGRISFDNRCIKCHQGNNPIAKGVNRTHLTNAFANLPMRDGKTSDKMLNFVGFFTNSELDDLVKFINEEM